ncbi:MAG: hypothetical protein Q8932_21235, partial [Bacteroidota bacterium]|nr:hypothetical protein [Bacteroidota bacterium]
MRIFTLAAVLVLSLLTLNYVSAQDTKPPQQVKFILVADSLTHKPLSFASAVFRDTRRGIIADVDGKLLLRYPLPDQTLTISRVGYRSRRFRPS